MLNDVAIEKLTEIAKAFDEDEIKCILKVIPSKFMVDELNRRNRVIFEQYNSLVNVIENIKDNESYDELNNMLNECRNILRGEVYE